LERSLGNFQQADSLYGESLVLAREQRDAHGVGLLLVNLSMVALQQERADEADDLVAQAIEVWQELDYRAGLVECVPVLAAVATLREDWRVAVRLFAAWKALGENAGREEYELDRAGFEEQLAIARRNLEARVFDAEWAAGKELTLAQALKQHTVADDPRRLSSTAAHGEPFAPLTQREWEVAQLVARGMSNRQIAADLVVTEATAAKHVENIRAKLELTSRTQVAAWLVGRTPIKG
jgi:DNA-binding CsgD family transcriptional regulator